MALAIVFWILVFIDAAALFVFGLLALAAAGPSHTNPILAVLVPVGLPALILAAAIAVFLYLPGPAAKGLALAIAAFPLVFMIASQGITYWQLRKHRDDRGGFSQFERGPLRELEAAIAAGDVATVRRLAPLAELDRPGISGVTVLVLALRRLRDAPHDLDIVRALLDAGADPNVGKDELPLQVAIGASRGAGLEPVRMLLAARADPNARSSFGEPVFFTAAGADQDPALMQLLLDRGADLHATTDTGKTALSVCAMTRNWKAALLLLQRGAPWEKAAAPGGATFRVYVESLAGPAAGDSEDLGRVLEFLRAADGSQPRRNG